MLSSVAVLAFDGVSMFGLGVTAEIFGCDRGAEGFPVYDYALTAAEPGAVRTNVGVPVHVPAGLDRFSTADLGIVVSWDQPDVRPPEPALEALRAAAGRGARMLSVCTGAFALADAGLLDGRRAATHWSFAKYLAKRFPAVEVDPDVLFVDEGQVLPSAGLSAGIDLSLHVKPWMTVHHDPRWTAEISARAGRLRRNFDA